MADCFALFDCLELEAYFDFGVTISVTDRSLLGNTSKLAPQLPVFPLSRNYSSWHHVFLSCPPGLFTETPHTPVLSDAGVLTQLVRRLCDRLSCGAPPVTDHLSVLEDSVTSPGTPGRRPATLPSVVSLFRSVSAPGPHPDPPAVSPSVVERGGLGGVGCDSVKGNHQSWIIVKKKLGKEMDKWVSIQNSGME